MADETTEAAGGADAVRIDRYEWDPLDDTPPAPLDGAPVVLLNAHDLSKLVQRALGRPWGLVRQRYRQRGDLVSFTVPRPAEPDVIEDTEDSGRESPELAEWLAADPPARGDRDEISRWEREWFPDLGEVAAELGRRGYLAPGDYAVLVDW